MRARSLFALVSLVALLGLAAAPRAGALAIGQVDDFEDGTTQGWLVGLLGQTSPVPPVNVATGGPQGADDNYLRLSSIGGLGPGSKLAVINVAQWAGDYLAAGVTGIALDVRNLGDTDILLRAMIATGAPPTDLAVSTNALLIPTGSPWQRVVVPIDPAGLTAGLGTIGDALSTATELRLLHSTLTTFPGEASVAQLGVDNITAVPEPTTALTIGVSLVVLGLRRRSRR
jgi:hypothetical protein